MSTFSYSINQVDKAVAGRTPYIIIPRKQETKRQFNYDGVKVYEEDDLHSSIIENTLGLPVFMSLEFEKNKQQGLGTNLVVPCCIVEVSVPKVIVKTEVQGTRNNKNPIRGTVKEYINLGDAIVSVKGILSDESGLYPDDQVKLLWEFFKAPVALNINHELLNMLEVYALVIENISFPSPQGRQNIQPFELQCVSDDDEWQQSLIKDEMKPL